MRHHGIKNNIFLSTFLVHYFNFSDEMKVKGFAFRTLSRFSQFLYSFIFFIYYFISKL